MALKERQHILFHRFIQYKVGGQSFEAPRAIKVFQKLERIAIEPIVFANMALFTINKKEKKRKVACK